MGVRILIAAIAVAPFVAVLIAMITGRARVDACCGGHGPADVADRHHEDSGV